MLVHSYPCAIYYSTDVGDVLENEDPHFLYTAEDERGKNEGHFGCRMRKLVVPS